MFTSGRNCTMFVGFSILLTHALVLASKDLVPYRPICAVDFKAVPQEVANPESKLSKFDIKLLTCTTDAAYTGEAFVGNGVSESVGTPSASTATSPLQEPISTGDSYHVWSLFDVSSDDDDFDVVVVDYLGGAVRPYRVYLDSLSEVQFGSRVYDMFSEYVEFTIDWELCLLQFCVSLVAYALGICLLLSLYWTSRYVILGIWKCWRWCVFFWRGGRLKFAGKINLKETTTNSAAEASVVEPEMQRVITVNDVDPAGRDRKVSLLLNSREGTNWLDLPVDAPKDLSQTVLDLVHATSIGELKESRNPMKPARRWSPKDNRLPMGVIFIKDDGHGNMVPKGGFARYGNDLWTTNHIAEELAIGDNVYLAKFDKDGRITPSSMFVKVTLPLKKHAWESVTLDYACYPLESVFWDKLGIPAGEVVREAVAGLNIFVFHIELVEDTIELYRSSCHILKGGHPWKRWHDGDTARGDCGFPLLYNSGAKTWRIAGIHKEGSLSRKQVRNGFIPCEWMEALNRVYNRRVNFMLKKEGWADFYPDDYHLDDLAAEKWEVDDVKWEVPGWGGEDSVLDYDDPESDLLHFGGAMYSTKTGKYAVADRAIWKKRTKIEKTQFDDRDKLTAAEYNKQVLATHGAWADSDSEDEWEPSEFLKEGLPKNSDRKMVLDYQVWRHLCDKLEVLDKTIEKFGFELQKFGPIDNMLTDLDALRYSAFPYTKTEETLVPATLKEGFEVTKWKQPKWVEQQLKQIEAACVDRELKLMAEEDADSREHLRPPPIETLPIKEGPTVYHRTLTPDHAAGRQVGRRPQLQTEVADDVAEDVCEVLEAEVPRELYDEDLVLAGRLGEIYHQRPYIHDGDLVQEVIVSTHLSDVMGTPVISSEMSLMPWKDEWDPELPKGERDTWRLCIQRILWMYELECRGLADYGGLRHLLREAFRDPTPGEGGVCLLRDRHIEQMARFIDAIRNKDSHIMAWFNDILEFDSRMQAKESFSDKSLKLGKWLSVNPKVKLVRKENVAPRQDETVTSILREMGLKPGGKAETKKNGASIGNDSGKKVSTEKTAIPSSAPSTPGSKKTKKKGKSPKNASIKEGPKPDLKIATEQPPKREPASSPPSKKQKSSENPPPAPRPKRDPMKVSVPKQGDKTPQLEDVVVVAPGNKLVAVHTLIKEGAESVNSKARS